MAEICVLECCSSPWNLVATGRFCSYQSAPRRRERPRLHAAREVPAHDAGSLRKWVSTDGPRCTHQCPRILYLVTEDWFFVSHFLPMARAARAMGFDVAVATQVGEKGDRIAAEGFRLLSIPCRRGNLGIVEGLRSILAMHRVVRAERPDIVHCIALRPVLLGGLAARLAGTPALILAPTGLGYLWTVDTLLTRLLRMAIRHVVGFWMRGPRTRYLFENREDPLEFGIQPDRQDVVTVGGAGVAPEDFPMVPEPPSPPVKLAVVSRMLKPKGIGDAVEATRLARKNGAPVELNLWQYRSFQPAIDRARDVAAVVLREGNPLAWFHEQIQRRSGASTILHCSSRATGRAPRTILEAAAAGRPIVTTDTPGCHDFVREGREGFLVGPGNIEAAAAAITRLAADPDLRRGMGRAANARIYEGSRRLMLPGQLRVSIARCSNRRDEGSSMP